jgi:cytochrome c oxidase subunit 3
VVDASRSQAICLDHLEVQFQDMEQQRLASSQAMWVFLATECLFFGTLLAGYTMLRYAYPHDFKIASSVMSVPFGSVNTLVLMTSSLFMALSVRAARLGRNGLMFVMLLITAALGTSFLVIKGFEYAFDLRQHTVPGATMHIDGYPATPPMHLFIFLYWVMTLFHALHLTIAIAAVGYLLVRTLFGSLSKDYYNPVEVVGLYWHFVDIVWLFLYPALYLAGASVK